MSSENTHAKITYEGSSMLIRKAKPEDIPRIAQIHLKSWQTTYKGILPKNYLDSLTEKNKEQEWHKLGLDYPNGQGITWVLENEGEVFGFANAGPQREPPIAGHGEVYCIYILKEFRRMGGGQLLIKEIVKYFKSRGYHSASALILKGNPFTDFYKLIGAEPTEERPFKLDGMDLIQILYLWKNIK
ncbi:GNAT family N-acetyltransferase [Fluviispira sanaruensis]|nr:GNAT family N-acetyltransferase [Fluviispira sanaruensis]